MQMPKHQNKGFFGDLLGAVLPAAGTLAGGALQAFGIPAPIGGAAGGFLGGKLGDVARRLPFKKGGRVPKPDASSPKKKKTAHKKKAPHMVKGSAAAKAYMAKIRKMKK